MALDPLAAAANNPKDVGSERITKEIYNALDGSLVHAITLDEIWKCIFQVEDYEPGNWTAILAKCGVASDRFGILLQIMTLASQDRRKLH
jgi:hypothetical protein